MALITKHGYNMYEVSSMLQKAIRRSNNDDAIFAVRELASFNKNLAWSRLKTVSAEDCIDFTTSAILGGNIDIECATIALTNARKSRDSDYFACNLLNSRDRIEIPFDTSNQFPTKNGHGIDDVKKSLEKAITETPTDFKLIGYCANELMVRYRKNLWRVLIPLGNTFPQLAADVKMLRDVDMEQVGSKNESSIFVAKAIMDILKTRIFGKEFFKDVIIPAHEPIEVNYKRIIPDYVFDCHTAKGKYLGRTKKDFVKTEQESLCPLTKCLFDECSWDRYFYLEANGFYNSAKLTPRPPKDVMKQIEDGIVQQTLF